MSSASKGRFRADLIAISIGHKYSYFLELMQKSKAFVQNNVQPSEIIAMFPLFFESNMTYHSPHLVQDMAQRKQLKARLLQSLKAAKGGLSVAEMSVRSTVSLEMTDYLLRELMEEYPLHLEVDKQQGLLYVFDFSRPKKTSVYDIFNQLIHFFWLLGAITLAVGWFLVALPMMASLVFFWFVAGLYQVFFNQGLHVGIQEYLFFWTGRPEQHSQALRELLLSHIVRQQYCIALPEIMRLGACTLEEAEALAVYLMVHYAGRPEVSEAGTIIFVFDDLRSQSHQASSLSPVFPKVLHPYQHLPIEALRPVNPDLPNDLPEVFTTKKYSYFVYLHFKIYLLRYFTILVLLLGTLFGLAMYFGAPPQKPEDIALLPVIYQGGVICGITLLLALRLLWVYFFYQNPDNQGISEQNGRFLFYEVIFEQVAQAEKSHLGQLRHAWQSRYEAWHKQYNSFQQKFIKATLSDATMERRSLEGRIRAFFLKLHFHTQLSDTAVKRFYICIGLFFITFALLKYLLEIGKSLNFPSRNLGWMKLIFFGDAFQSILLFESLQHHFLLEISTKLTSGNFHLCWGLEKIRTLK